MPPASKTFPEAIAAKDVRSLRYVFVNRAAEKLFDLPRASIMGKTARELFPVTLADMIEQADRRLLEGNEQTPYGPRVHAVRRIPICDPDGEAHVFLSMIEDRTDWPMESSGATLAA